MPAPHVSKNWLEIMQEAFRAQKASKFTWPEDFAVSSYSIWVTGTFSSGKTTFIEAISEIPVRSIEYYRHNNERSEAVDFGYISCDTYYLQFFGGPGSWRLKRNLFEADIKSGRLLGVVVLYDSAQLASLREMRSILNIFRAPDWDHPYVIVANKQDRPNAWEPEDLKIALKVSSEELFLPCCSIDRESVKQVLITFLEYVKA